MIGRVVQLNATVQRSGDEAAIKHNEVNKSMVNQMNASSINQKEVMRKNTEVVKKDNADYNNQKYDAKEKGKGEYFINKKKNQNNKNQEEEEDGKVIIKSGGGGFDMKI